MTLSADDVAELRAAAGLPEADPADPAVERVLRAWHKSPPEATDALTAQQVKTLLVDDVRLRMLRAARDADDLMADVRARVRERRGARVAVLSGAGISVDAGFPTFRGADGEGLWENVDPMELASTTGYARNPLRTLRWYCWRRSLGLPAVPTLAHAAIAAAQHAEPERWAGVHTQNVDGLHEAAGNEGVNRIHGSIWCWREVPGLRLVFGPSDRLEDVPMHADGRPAVRPGVVMFGDHAPMHVYERAIAELLACEVAFVVGTSAQVSTLWPLLHAARQAGALLVEINPEPSPVTHELGALPLPVPSGLGVPLALEEIGALDPTETERLARTPRPPLETELPGLEADLLRDRVR